MRRILQPRSSDRHSAGHVGLELALQIRQRVQAGLSPFSMTWTAHMRSQYIVSIAQIQQLKVRHRSILKQHTCQHAAAKPAPL